MCLVGVAVVVVMALLGRLLAGPTTGLIAAAIAAIYPGFWINDSLVMAETPTTLMVAALVCAVIHHRRRSSLLSAAVMGALLALASLKAVGVIAVVGTSDSACCACCGSLWTSRLRHITVATTLALLLLLGRTELSAFRRTSRPVDQRWSHADRGKLTTDHRGEATGFGPWYQQALAPAIPGGWSRSIGCFAGVARRSAHLHD